MADNATTSGGSTSRTTKKEQATSQVEDTTSEANDQGWFNNSSAETKEITFTVAKDVDPGQVEIARRMLSARRAPIVGNLADVQRMGAAAAAGEGNPVDAGVLLPPDQSGNGTATVSYEDTVAPGPSGMTADAAEEVFGSRTAQGDRPDSVDEGK